MSRRKVIFIMYTYMYVRAQIPSMGQLPGCRLVPVGLYWTHGYITGLVWRTSIVHSIYLRLPQLFSSTQECSFPPTFNRKPILFLPPPRRLSVALCVHAPRALDCLKMRHHQIISSIIAITEEEGKMLFIPKLGFSPYSLLCGCVHVYSMTRPA